MPKNLPAILKENVRSLLNLPEGKSGVAVLIALGVSNGTAGRVLEGETSIGLDKLADLAERLKVEPWQLLVPGLDPPSLPALVRGPNFTPGAAHVLACLDQMDDAGRDIIAKMADALIRPTTGSLEMPTAPLPQLQ